MKKTLKLLFIIIISFSLFMMVGQIPCYADDASTITGQIKGSPKSNSDINNLAKNVISYLWGFSIIVAVVVLMVIGLKFIVGSTQEKAEYKKSLIPIVVGVLLVVFATTIVNFLFSVGA